ncbi:hypothetical protein [Pontibacter burrus]|uniref:Uncharacterized protein n=1 Tax=Pontibacter burrus TaxID=2704466 RepID=A0A6B3LKW8_9BACT|nr:hypothetical protein [Pontibacter burrus]NEM97419.1 hypothetical protein [Pontibacter burrus]
MVNSSFLDAFEKALSKNKINKNNGPNYFIEGWGDLISACNSGFQFSSSEFDYELLIRDEIEKILQSKELEKYAEFQLFKDKIKELDDEFRKCTHPQYKLPIKTNNWWQNSVLKYSGELYAEQIKKHFGFDIQVLKD